MHRVHDDHFIDVAILYDDLEALALFSFDETCLTVKSWEIHALLHGRFSSEMHSLSFFELRKIAGQTDLTFLAHLLLQLVSCPSAESANSCDHFDNPPIRDTIQTANCIGLYLKVLLGWILDIVLDIGCFRAILDVSFLDNIYK